MDVALVFFYLFSPVASEKFASVVARNAGRRYFELADLSTDSLIIFLIR